MEPIIKPRTLELQIDRVLYDSPTEGPGLCYPFISEYQALLEEEGHTDNKGNFDVPWGDNRCSGIITDIIFDEPGKPDMEKPRLNWQQFLDMKRKLTLTIHETREYR